MRPDSLHIRGMPGPSKKRPDPQQGFGEAPQSEFEGKPLSVSVADWAEELRRQAEAESIETRREVASKAGKHRRKAAARSDEDTAEVKPRAPRANTAKAGKSSSFKTARGTS
ncbi:MAG: hypothetical protein ACTHJ3_19665, partial [Pararhizobium sp.]